MRKFLAGLVVVVFILSLTVNVSSRKIYTIGFSNASTSNIWRIAMNNFAMTEFRKLGVKVVYRNANDDPKKQITDVEQLLSKKIDALMISPATDALSLVISKAYDTGIPVIVFDRKVKNARYTTFVVTNDVKNGNKAGEWVVKVLIEKYGKPAGNVVEIQALMGCSNQIDRHTGIMEILNKYPDIKVIASDAADFQLDKGKFVMAKMLKQNSKIDVVVSQDGATTVGAIVAIKEAGRMNEMKIVSIDGYNELLKAIKRGEVVSTQLFPASLGAEAVRVTLKALNGKKIPKYWEYAGAEVTPDNVDIYINMDSPDSSYSY